MGCLNFYWVQFLVLLLLYLVNVLSELLKGPVPGLLLLYLVDVLSEILCGPFPGLTLIIFGGCVV